jgi:hypothetical protein
MSVADDLAKSSQAVYQAHSERAALRCALGDAAALCDGLSRDIAAENRGYGGKGPVTKRGLELEAIAKRCADAIWAMREKIGLAKTYDRDNASDIAKATARLLDL